MASDPPLEGIVSETKEIGRASGILALFTLLSRILGLIRNQILSHFFGAGFISDAFIAAFTIPNALRRLFGEGALTPAIVSHLTQNFRDAKRSEQWQTFLSNAFVWLSFILIALTMLGIVLAPLIVRAYVPEYAETPGKLELTIRLTRVLFPFIIFIGWAAFFMGVLNSFRSFAISAVGSSLLNLTVILIVPIGMHFLMENPTLNGIYLYCAALLIGGFVQFSIQLPKILKLGCLSKLFDFDWRDSRVNDLARMLIPSVLSMGVYQLNIIVNRAFASRWQGGVSHLYYADLVLELPLALVATSIGTAVLPSFARMIADKNRMGLADAFKVSLEGVWMFAFPAAVGLSLLSTPIVSTLFFSGKFLEPDVSITSKCLLFYAIGIPFFSAIRIVLPLFFAERNSKTPAKIAVFALSINFLAAFFLSPIFHSPGIALGSSLSAIANLAMLVVILYKKYPDFKWKKIGSESVRLILASLTMGLVIALFQYRFFDSSLWFHEGGRIRKIAELSFLILVGGITYFLFGFAMGVGHIRRVSQKFLKGFENQK